MPESLFNKVAGLRPEACNFFKKESVAQVFSCEFCEISKNTFLTDDCFRTFQTVTQKSADGTYRIHNNFEMKTDYIASENIANLGLSF